MDIVSLISVLSQYVVSLSAHRVFSPSERRPFPQFRSPLCSFPIVDNRL
jgi:hypothetical protein